VANNKIIVAAVVCGVLVLAGNWTAWIPSIVRLLAVMPLVLFLPGFLLLRALLPKGEVDFECVILSIGISVASTVVFGLILHSLDAMNSLGWTVAVAFVVMGALWLSRSRGGVRYLGAAFQWSALGLNGASMVCFGVITVLVTGGIALASYGAANQRQFAYTELWIVPFDGHSNERVTIGVRNKEQKHSSYDLEVLVNDKLLVRWPEFDLSEDEEWVKQLPIPMNLGVGQRVEARLYNHDSPLRLYRRVWLSRANVTDH
jgi:uncharacterized membrane protein